jgi:hypothetical protein
MKLAKIRSDLGDLRCPSNLILAEFKYTFAEKEYLPVCEIVVVLKEVDVEAVMAAFNYNPLAAHMHHSWLMAEMWTLCEELSLLGLAHGFESWVTFEDEESYVPRWKDKLNWINLH